LYALREVIAQKGTAQRTGTCDESNGHRKRFGKVVTRLTLLYRLLRAAEEAKKTGSRKYVEIVQQIHDDHVQAAKETIKSLDILADFERQATRECDNLIKVLESAQNLEEVSSKAENKIISKGEKLSCRYMASLLQDRGVPAQYVDLSDVITNYNVAIISNDIQYHELATALGAEIEACGDKVPIITGYFGHVPGGLLHSIGRGYTDLCAALVAVGIQAKELQVWKEVDGIFTADPRKVPTAARLDAVTPSEAAELTFYGSEVIHPFTMEQVIRARIPIRIKNVMNPRGPGTVIYPDPEEEKQRRDSLCPPIFRSRSSASLGSLALPEKRKRPTAVTIKHSIIVLNIHSNKRTRAHGFLASIFQILDRHHLSVDLISSSEVHVSMALHSEIPMLTGGVGEDQDFEIIDQSLKAAVHDLAVLGEVDLMGDMAIVSLVGKHLKNMTGISGKFFSVLGDNNINIEMISQGKPRAFLLRIHTSDY
jgi:aspartate kinase